MTFLNFIVFFLVISCLAVVFSRNPVQSVLFLVLVFIFNSLFFLLLGSDFLAILVLIIYVGAISTLFLFVVMMFDLRQTELQNFYISYLPIGCFIGLVVFFELLYVFYNDFFTNPYSLYFSSNVFNYE
jgi:NADH-quinone oxidoreductase subunit J